VLARRGFPFSQIAVGFGLSFTRLTAFGKTIAEIEPRFTKNAEHLTDWQQVTLLSVEANRCPEWHRKNPICKKFIASANGPRA
jgi:hypothetical protein